MSKVVTKTEYEKAVAQVAKFEKRQSKLNEIEGEIAQRLSEYGAFKFKIEKKNGEIIFAGFHHKQQKMLIGVAMCSESDVFDTNIGKLIAMRKAEHQKCDDLYEIVEKKGCFDLKLQVGGTFMGKDEFTSPYFKEILHY
jgi:hypothetical protein